MGVDLYLLPVDALHGTWGFSHTVLSVPRTRDLWSAMGEANLAEALPSEHNISSFVGQRVPDGACKGETMYGKIRDTDSYGEPWTWTTSAQLLPLLIEHVPNWPGTAYVAALPPGSRIILGWH